jgi:hypothetical protein
MVSAVGIADLSAVNGTFSGDLTVDSATFSWDSTYLKLDLNKEFTVPKLGVGSLPASGPLGTAHIVTSHTGSVGSHIKVDDLIVENDGDAGINILSADDSYATIGFSRSISNSGSGAIQYNHNDDTLNFWADSSLGTPTVGMTLSSGGDLEITGDLTVDDGSSYGGKIDIVGTVDGTNRISAGGSRMTFYSDVNNESTSLSGFEWRVDGTTSAESIAWLSATEFQLDGGDLNIAWNQGGGDIIQLKHNATNAYAGEIILYDTFVEKVKIAADGESSIAGDLTIGGDLSATLSTSAQPNITSLGTLTSLNVNGDIKLTTDDFLGWNDFTSSVAGVGLIGRAFEEGGNDVETLTLYTEGLKRFEIDSSKEFVFYRPNATGIAEAMRLSSDGNLGIGESNPLAKLHSKDSTKEQAIFSGWSTTGANASSGAIRLGGNASYQGRIDYAADGNTEFSFDNTYSSGIYTFKIAGSEAMRIDSSGNVEINGSAGPLFSVKSTASGTPTAFIYSSTNGADFGSLTNHPTRFYVNNSERMRIDSSGNVGIGVDPIVKLHIKETNSSCSIFLDSTAATDQQNRIVSLTNSGGAYSSLLIDANTHIFRTATTERMRINSSGNVGINCSPDALLNVRTPNTVAENVGLLLNTTNNTTNAGIAISFGFNNGTGTTPNGSVISAIKTASGGSNLVFKTNDSNAAATEAMRIDSSGNVEVNGGGYLSIDTGANAANPRLYFRQDSISATNFIEVDRGTNAMEFWNNGSEAMRIDSSGNVGIGDSNPSDKITIYQGSTSTDAAIRIRGNRFYNSSANVYTKYDINSGAVNSGKVYKWETGMEGDANGQNFIFKSTTTGGTTERMRINSSGNVGIGTGATISNRLHILGTTDGTTSIKLERTGSATSIFGSNYIGTFSNNEFRFYTNSSEKMRITSGGDVYAYEVYNRTTGISANMYIHSDGLLHRSTSSIKYKTNVQDYDKGIETIMQLRPVSYEGLSETDSGKTYAGFIAEEIHEAGLIEFVQYDSENNPDALSYGAMVSLLTKAMQEQQEIINDLIKRIETLENKQNGISKNN